MITRNQLGPIEACWGMVRAWCLMSQRPPSWKSVRPTSSSLSVRCRSAHTKQRPGADKRPKRRGARHTQ